MLWTVTFKFLYQRIILSVLAGLLLCLSFPPLNLEFLAWFAFIPLFFVLDTQDKKNKFLLSYICGLTFWLGNIYWLAHVTLTGMVLLAMYLSLYFALFGWIVAGFYYKPVIFKLIFIPSIWVLLEYLRSNLLTGFPWSLLAYSQYLNLGFIQVSDIAGAWAVSFILVLANVALKECLSRKIKIIQLAFIVVVLLLVLIYGLFRLSAGRRANNSSVISVSVIQGNIPQELKWDPEARPFIINKQLGLSRESLKDNPDLIIWPEASWPIILNPDYSYPQELYDFVRNSKAALLLGAITFNGDLYYNSALLFKAKEIRKYDKLHLVPFGEYVPLRKAFSFLETIAPIGDIQPGRDPVIFEIKNQKSKNKFAVLICFEDVFPDLSRDFVNKGAEFLVNITNDAWYKKTAASCQHLQASVFRAVENRVYLARAANTGVSAFIDSNGKVISEVQDGRRQRIFVEGYKTEKIPIRASGKKTLYTILGDWFILLCAGLAAAGLWLNSRKKR